MRYDKKICFQRVTESYDPTTGNYAAESVETEEAYANITASKIEALKLIYGEIKQGTITIRLQRKPKNDFDRIEVGGKIYKVDYSRPLRNGVVYVASEVQ